MAEFTKERIIEELKASTQNANGMFEISEDTICDLMSLLTCAAPQLPLPAVGDGRDQFEEWFKFHHGDEHSIVKLHRANGGANYRDPHVDLAWIAWKDSRAAMLQGAEPVSQPYTLPEGMVIVPVEPTREMRLQIHPIAEATCMECGRSVTADCEDNVLLSWADMIAAAPQQEAE